MTCSEWHFCKSNCFAFANLSSCISIPLTALPFPSSCFHAPSPSSSLSFFASLGISFSILFVSSELCVTVTALKVVHTLSTHEISCCGVGISPDSCHICVGDLAGNVYLYGLGKSSAPLEMWNVSTEGFDIVWHLFPCLQDISWWPNLKLGCVV